MKKILIGFPLSCFLSNSPAFAKDAIDPPWEIQNENGQFGGAEIEMCEYLAEKPDFEMQIEVVPFKHCLHYMETGTADMMAGIFKRPAREVYIDPPCKGRSDKKVFMCLRVKKDDQNLRRSL